MIACVDTSFLFSLYASDANSARADLWRQSNPMAFYVSPLNRLEMVSAMQQSVFRDGMPVRDASAALDSFLWDLGNGGMLLHAMLNLDLVYAEAEKLLLKFGALTGTRSPDAIHIASALMLRADLFVTFDERQSTLGVLAGLRVEVP